ncbi:hypothetical protein Tco_0304957 [Tanacetum coccineum]
MHRRGSKMNGYVFIPLVTDSSIIPLPKCRDHDPQPTPVYSYCFKEIVGDEMTTISITCFSDEASTMIKDCDEVLAEIEDKNPYHLSSSLKALEDKEASRIEAPKKTIREALFEGKTTSNESTSIKKMKHA